MTDAQTRDPGGLHRPQDGIGEDGCLVPGPPWILGHRGAPGEAPENTLASLMRAVELGLDGCAYDVRACATGELVLLADATVDRTTDGSGPLAEKTLPELSGLDAGAWFSKSYSGEPLALVEEALALEGNQAGTWPQHLIEVREPGLLPLLARALEGRAERLSVRVASPHARVCCEARDLGLAAMLMCHAAGERELAIVRDEGLAACATAPGGWEQAPAAELWNAERWSLGLDRPEDLLWACRAGLNGFHTNAPRRALAVRALAFLTSGDASAHPLRVPVLDMSPGARLEGPGEWCGCWELEAQLHNPLPFPVHATLELVVGRGAFEAQGLPLELKLRSGQRAQFSFVLAGGSWEPGGDPTLAVHLRWRPGPGRPEERLVLDAPLERVRSLHLGAGSVRIELLRERPGQGPASVTARRHGGMLLLASEHAGGLDDARLVCVLDGVQHVGGVGLRVALPEDFGQRAGGVPFSVGLLGRALGSGPGPGAWTWRRWAGGLPDDLRSGPPGRLLPEASA